MEEFPDGEQKQAEEREKFLREALGRNEYRDGSTPLNFEHKFSNLNLLKATQNENGIATISFEKEGKSVMDLKGLLPEGYDYMTPRYVLDHEEEFSAPVFLGTWGAYQKLKMVHVGDWTKPEHVFNLLHEVGHTWQNASELEWLRDLVGRKKKEVPDFDRTSEGQHLLRQWAEALSKSERGAWAFALHSAQKIRDTLGIHLVQEIFKTPEEIESYIQKALHTYKEVQEEVEWRDGGVFLKKLFDKSF